MEKIYEERRSALIALRDKFGRGAIAHIAKETGLDSNYVSRLLYPAGKAGKKNIGDETVQKLDQAFPGWMAASTTAKIETATPTAEEERHQYSVTKNRATTIADRIRHLPDDSALLNAVEWLLDGATKGATKKVSRPASSRDLGNLTGS